MAYSTYIFRVLLVLKKNNRTRLDLLSISQSGGKNLFAYVQSPCSADWAMAGMVANPACYQVSTKKTFLSPVPVLTSKLGLVGWIRPSRSTSVHSFPTPRLDIYIYIYIYI